MCTKYALSIKSYRQSSILKHFQMFPKSITFLQVIFSRFYSLNHTYYKTIKIMCAYAYFAYLYFQNLIIKLHITLPVLDKYE